ncbi:MAG: hypothetical protein ABW155_04315 [Candidatus Thiodiazotropha sp.]
MSRLREAVSEIKKVAKKYPLIGAECAVRLMEKIWPALEHADSSSGALGSVVNKTLDALLLLGMGINALSMSVLNIARVKLAIRSTTQQQARRLLNEVLGIEDGIAIHRLLSSALKEAGVHGY